MLDVTTLLTLFNDWVDVQVKVGHIRVLLKAEDCPYASVSKPANVVILVAQDRSVPDLQMEKSTMKLSHVTCQRQQQIEDMSQLSGRQGFDCSSCHLHGGMSMLHPSFAASPGYIPQISLPRYLQGIHNLLAILTSYCRCYI